jgi:hypothetical protein
VCGYVIQDSSQHILPLDRQGFFWLFVGYVARLGYAQDEFLSFHYFDRYLGGILHVMYMDSSRAFTLVFCLMY